jgi:peptidoglycan/LPS O-acetylase OafA/YrhL
MFRRINRKERCGTARLFAWLGGVSYGVYIWQTPLYDIVGGPIVAAAGVSLTGASLFWGVASVVLVIELVIIAERISTGFLTQSAARAFQPRAAG